MITFLIVSFCERSLQLILNHDISNLKGVKLGHKKVIRHVSSNVPLKKVTHTISWYEVLNTRFPHTAECEKAFFSRPKKCVVMRYMPHFRNKGVYA